MKIQENTPLAPLTYYKIGGPARYFAQPSSEDDLFKLAEFISKNKLNFFILGSGSNILVSDDGFDGVVIQTTNLNRTLEEKENKIKVGCSVMVIQLLRYCMAQGRSGLELLVGIPGNMGGVFFMNAGTRLGEISSVLREVTTFDLKNKVIKNYNKNDLQYDYRTQKFLTKDEIILSGVVEVRSELPDVVQKQITNLLDIRKKSQPIDKPSCGSVFKNPSSTQHAWQLIDDVGLRGYRIGQAQISEMHTNFIVNLGGAKAVDVASLIAEAKKRVYEKHGILLEEEVKYI